MNGLLATGLLLAPELATLGLALIGIGVPLLLLIWLRPEIGLLAVVFLAASLIPADIVDLRLPVGGLELRDLILIGMIGLLIVQGLIKKRLVIPCWRVSAPLLVLLLFSFVSVFYALFLQKVEARWAFSEFRALIFYSVFFVTSMAITSQGQMPIVLISLFVFADLIAGVLTLQQFLGSSQFLLTAMLYSNWRVYDLQQAGAERAFGMVRIMPPGVTLVYFMMVIAVCLMLYSPGSRKLRWWLVFQMVYLNVGLLLTYTRALWIAAAFAIGLILLAIFPRYKTYLIRYFVAGCVISAVLVGLLTLVPLKVQSDSNILATFTERFYSILNPENTLESDSLQWRVFENTEGLRAISAHPLLGVGLGNSYRAISTTQGEAEGYRTGGSIDAGAITRMTRFIHNSYLYLTVKMGVPALLVFLWFCAAVILQSWHLYRHLAVGPSKGICLAICTGFIGLMLWSFFHQHFMSTESIAVVGVMTGLVASIESINTRGGNV